MDKERIKDLEEDLQARVEIIKNKADRAKRGMLFAILLLSFFLVGMLISVKTTIDNMEQILKNIKQSDERLVKEVRSKFELDAQEELNGNKDEIKR